LALVRIIGVAQAGGLRSDERLFPFTTFFNLFALYYQLITVIDGRLDVLPRLS